MSLNFHVVGGDINEENRTLEKIDYARSLYEAQIKKAEKEEYIKNLLLEDYVNQIRQYYTRYDVIDIFGKAQEEVGKKLKKERPHLETIKQFVMDDFLSNDKNFKIKNIISMGYEGYAWKIEFDAYDKTVYLEIPVKRRLTAENVHYAHDGMFAFGVYESEHYLRTLKTSYDIKTMSDYIREWAIKEKFFPQAKEE